MTIEETIEQVCNDFINGNPLEVKERLEAMSPLMAAHVVSQVGFEIGTFRFGGSLDTVCGRMVAWRNLLQRFYDGEVILTMRP